MSARVVGERTDDRDVRADAASGSTPPSFLSSTIERAAISRAAAAELGLA